MPLSKDFTAIFIKEIEVNFLNCYPNGFLKYTDLCNILQLTAASHSELGNLSYSDMQLHNQAWVLSRMRVEITELPKWKDIITVKTWIVDMQGSRSVRALEIYKNDIKIVGALTHWVVLNTKLRKAENLVLPHGHFITYPDNISTLKSFEKRDLNQELKTVSNRTIVLSDLDIVNHANNVKYLEWCLDSLNYKEILRQKIKSFDMNFLRELHFNDNITIESSLEEIPNSYFVKKQGKNCFALKLEYK